MSEPMDVEPVQAQERPYNFAEEVEELVKLIHEKYISNVPSNLKVDEIYHDPCNIGDATSLFKELQTAEVDPDGFINIDLAIIKILYGKLMIRKAYIDLAKKLLDTGEKYLIIGSPGTGKTVFCIFMMFLFVKARIACDGMKDFPFFFDLQGSVGFFHQGELQIMKKSFLDSHVLEPYNLYFLYDDQPTAITHFARPTNIVFSSPRKDRYREYAKDGTKKYFMPMWTEEEIKRLNGHINRGKLSEEELDDRFSYAGGVPRWIFKDWDEFKISVGSGLGKITPEYLIEDAITCFEAGPHSIIGISVDETTYKINGILIRTEKLKVQVLGRFLKKGTGILQFALENSENFENAGVALSGLYQNLAMEQMCFGTDTDDAHFVALNNETKSLCNDGGVMKLKLPRVGKKLIKDFKEVVVNFDNACMWVPKGKTFPLVDYIYTLPKMGKNGAALVLGLQMTLNAEHFFSYKNLNEYAQRFGENYVHVWVSTGTPYEAFRRRPQSGSDKKVLAPEMELKVPQFKLNVYAGNFKIPPKNEY